MKKRISIQFKAAFLMAVFSLNTVIGFACAIGIDMGFNSKDHHDKEAVQTSVHVHADGKKHIHHDETNKKKHDESRQQDEVAIEPSVHVHADGKKHIHHEAKKYAGSDKTHHKSKDTKDDCCNDKVVKLNDVDKSASHSLSGNISPIFFTIFLASFYSLNTFYTSYIDTGIKYFVRSHHPPIPDIRIAIQSFQI